MAANKDEGKIFKKNKGWAIESFLDLNPELVKL